MAKNHVSKSKKEIRPLSGGISQKQFSKAGESRSRVQNAQHNMSMFENIGPTSKLQQSPGPIDFHNKMPTHLKPVGKMPGHNQSFDSIPMHSKLVSHAGQHGSKLGGNRAENKLVSSAQHSLKGAHLPTHGGSSAALQGVVSGSGG